MVTNIQNKETVGTATIVSNYAYSYNALGQRADRTQSSDTGGAFSQATKDTFSYDELGQLTASSNDTHAASNAYNPVYAYDTIGNRSGNTTDLNGTRNYLADELNQYTAVGSETPTYDDDGNMTSYGVWTFTWNGENRLASATNGSLTVLYTYDDQGRLIARDDGGLSDAYFYDGWNRIAKYVNGTADTAYLWGPDLSSSMQGAGGVGGLLKEGSLYPCYDANGNIVQKLANDGSVSMAVEYDPFGNILNGTLVGEYGFSSKPQDTETGFYYYGYRYYDPVTGRWPSRDPIEEEGGVNLYGFVGNDGIGEVDVLGMMTYNEAMIAGGNDATAKTLASEEPGKGKWSRREYCGLICGCGKEYKPTSAHAGQKPQLKQISYPVKKNGKFSIKTEWIRTGSATCNALMDADGNQVSCKQFCDSWKIVGAYHSHPTNSGWSPSDDGWLDLGYGFSKATPNGKIELLTPGGKIVTLQPPSVPSP